MGGGFSGTMLAVHLLRQSSSMSVAVMDSGSLRGRGLAYSSPHKFHLLNVPAGEMSAYPGVPNDFLQWARIHFNPNVSESSFPPRSIYGAYIGDLLEQARSKAGRERLEWLHNTALSLRRSGRHLALQALRGPEILARVVVLATGNFPPANPRVAGLETAGHYFQFPWSPNALEGIPANSSVLLLLDACGGDVKSAPWYREDWIRETLVLAPKAFDAAFARWRELYTGAVRHGD